jgi:hypothetical protein
MLCLLSKFSHQSNMINGSLTWGNMHGIWRNYMRTFGALWTYMEELPSALDELIWKNFLLLWMTLSGLALVCPSNSFKFLFALFQHKTQFWTNWSLVFSNERTFWIPLFYANWSVRLHSLTFAPNYRYINCHFKHLIWPV